MLGLHGLTLLTVLIFASPAMLADRRTRAGRGGCPALASRRSRHGAPSAAGVLSGTTPAWWTSVQLRIMQPDVPQDDKFRPANRNEIMARYLDLTDRATGPETPASPG